MGVVGGTDGGRHRNGVNALNVGSLLTADGSGDASVDAEDGVIDGGGEGKAVEDGVGSVPDLSSESDAETGLALAEEAPHAVEGLPALRSGERDRWDIR